MIRSTIYSFDDRTSVGIDKVPLNGVILVEDSGLGDTTLLILKDKTSITSGTTIDNLLENYNDQWIGLNSSVNVLDDITLYVETTGDDVNGTGDISAPFATPQRALETLKDKIIVAEVTIQIGIGEFMMTEPLVIEHANADKISIFGAGILAGGTHITDVHYTPRDGVYNPDDRKWLVSAQALNDHNANAYQDWDENKAVLRREYLTILNFDNLDGIIVRNTSLKALDDIALLSNYPDVAQGANNLWNLGINIGKDVTWDEGNFQPKNGSITLGTAKGSSNVVIAGFNGGIAIEGVSVELGTPVILNCYGGVSSKGCYIHYVDLHIIRCSVGVFYDEVALTPGGNYIYGCRYSTQTSNTVMYNEAHLIGNYYVAHDDNSSLNTLTIMTGQSSILSFNNKYIHTNTDKYDTRKLTLKIYDGGDITQTDVDNIFENWTVNKDVKISINNMDDSNKFLENAPWNIPLDVLQVNGACITSDNVTLGGPKDYIPKIETDTLLSAYTPHFGKSDYFEYTLTENSTINNPIGFIQGQKGDIIILQDATGGWTCSFGGNWIFPGGAPTINTSASAYNVFKYTVLASNKVLMEFVADFI